MSATTTRAFVGFLPPPPPLHDMMRRCSATRVAARAVHLGAPFLVSVLYLRLSSPCHPSSDAADPLRSRRVPWIRTPRQRRRRQRRWTHRRPQRAPTRRHRRRRCHRGPARRAPTLSPYSSSIKRFRGSTGYVSTLFSQTWLCALLGDQRWISCPRYDLVHQIVRGSDISIFSVGVLSPLLDCCCGYPLFRSPGAKQWVRWSSMVKSSRRTFVRAKMG